VVCNVEIRAQFDEKKRKRSGDIENADMSAYETAR
jgi:hypothetical protein